MKRRILVSLLAVVVIVASAAAAQYGYDRLSGSDTNESSTPAPPTSLNGGPLSTKSILVVWSGPDRRRVDAYEIFRDDVAIATTNLLSFTDFDLEPGTAYRYRIRAREGEGDDERWSPLSSPIELMTESDPG